MSTHDTPTGNVVQKEMAYLREAAPHDPSSIGDQIRLDHYYKKALIAIRDNLIFGQLADVRAMPKNMGKTIKQFKYIPILDDANVNDQGIDAAGAAIVAPAGGNWMLKSPDTIATDGTRTPGAIGTTGYATKKAAETAATGGQLAVQVSGNLYGSSNDVGYISAKLPALTEHGGRVNRIGFTRVVIQGTLVKRGFFSEYTQESMDFDTDSELMSHIVTESLVAANEIVEDSLQIDLINAAGVVRWPGAATSLATVDGTVTAAGDVPANGVITYDSLLKFSIQLDDNKAPKQSKIITGSRNIDTRTVPAARYLYAGSELIPMFEKMTDYHNQPAFKGVEQYGAAATVAMGEIGAVGHFRIIIADRMLAEHGMGAASTDNKNGYRTTGGHFDVFPLLFVGSGSFATIGWQTNGKTVKFTIIHKKPGYETATAHDPYGEKGHYAIKWYYGFMALRPEWIGLMWTVA